MKYWSLAAALVLGISLLVPASSGAANVVGQLQTQIEQLSLQVGRHQQQLATARSKTPVLLQLREQARQQVPVLARRLDEAQQRTSGARRGLNRLTLNYITLVEQLGGNPAAAGMTDAQQLVQYLASSQVRDATLVFQQSRVLLERQQRGMQRLRRAAIRLRAAQNRQLQISRAHQRTVYLAKQAFEDNQFEVIRLTAKLGGERNRLAGLRSRLAIIQGSSGGGVLTPGQVVFAYRLAELSRLDVNVIKAWVLAEMSGPYARAREVEHNHNWLNVGYFDSLGGDGAFQGLPRVWQSPKAGAEATQAFLQGDFLGASAGIQRILSTAGKSPRAQIRAIAISGWASSGYGGGTNLVGTYRLVPHTPQPPHTVTRWKSPRDGQWYWLGV